MVKHDFLEVTDNRSIISDESGKWNLVEYEQDMSVNPLSAQSAFFASRMNVRKRQVAINLQNDSAILQAGAMQWFSGDINVTTDVKSAGKLMKKVVSSAVTKESVIKPRYEGTGTLVLEPTYKFLLLEDLDDWGGNMVIEDGLFLACDGDVNINTVARSTMSSAAFGHEGWFNTKLSGSGIVVLESYVPKEELITVDLVDDIIKIDGPFAIAWSHSLKFTVERTTQTLIGSAASKEGLVNVYRGTGRILMAPVAYTPYNGGD